MKNDDKINQVYESINKKSVASASLYDHKVQRNDAFVKFTPEVKKSSPTSKKENVNLIHSMTKG
ncbi:hypothetical protein [uncultured Legionella sp.]|uniref:hypothetical protein n=1 Tax=uncultured Legionella sp. TaxID=210934 RepID=UPI00263238B1|nr:hypothetical protein [uncultured Legionella sp.]